MKNHIYGKCYLIPQILIFQFPLTQWINRTETALCNETLASSGLSSYFYLASHPTSSGLSSYFVWPLILFYLASHPILSDLSSYGPI